MTSEKRKAAAKAFMTKRFSRDAKKAGISDTDLLQAVAELEGGQGQNLGANVWKKRLNENRNRSVVITKPGDFWVFIYLFAKSDRDNIDADELSAFKKLAGDYAAKGMAGIYALLGAGKLTEICE